jgi:hypothetical protein
MVDVGVPIGSVKVTAVGPDTIKLDDPDAGPSLNLFLYRVSPNPGWRNAALPSYGPDGARATNPPLALDLHYLLTAYGSADFHAEILLGYAMHLLHERPVLDRASIRTALDPSPLGPSILPPAFQALAAADLADQVEAVTVTPEPMDSEGMSRLWSALQTHYRPSAAYLVSVVLIESTKPAKNALPVLSRGRVDPITERDRGVVVEPSLVPPFPTVERVVPQFAQPAARLSEPVRLEGHHLAGSSVMVRLSHRLLESPHTIVVGANDDPSGIDITIPSGAGAQEDWPAGLYTVTARLIPPGGGPPIDTNVAALMLAPVPHLPPQSIQRDPASGRVSVTLDVSPQVRPSQKATLSLGGETASADPRTTPTSTLTFAMGQVPEGDQWVRLIVDGVESVLVDRKGRTPVFDPTQSLLVPA